MIQQKPDCPLSEEQQRQALDIVCESLGLQDRKAIEFVEPGQPLRLNLLEALARRVFDTDTALIQMLRDGVTTGVLDPIPSSLQWPKKSQPYQDFLPLEMCEGNWSAAEAKRQVVQTLIDKEIEQGWVCQVMGGRQEAESRWPSATAVGKLNLVEAPEKDPRLVLDSAICQVNPNCSLPEAVQLPTVSDVCFSFQPSDPHSMWIGASLDFKAAHKQVKVRPKDQGLLLFEFQSKLYGYVVCHFGARFSAYWWQRLGALLLRIAHSLLASQPHKAWLYVDDLLAALLRSSGDLQLGLLVTVRVPQKPNLLEEGSPRGLPHLVWLEV